MRFENVYDCFFHQHLHFGIKFCFATRKGYKDYPGFNVICSMPISDASVSTCSVDLSFTHQELRTVTHVACVNLVCGMFILLPPSVLAVSKFVFDAPDITEGLPFFQRD